MSNQFLQFSRFGKPIDVLQIGHKAVSPVSNEDILVRMTTRPINPSDVIPITGAYAHRIPLPAIPGYEGVGIVEEVGSVEHEHLIGQRVLPLLGEGTWQEFVKAPAELAVPIPAFMDDDTSAQLYINPLTAWLICVEVLQIKQGDVLLVNACGSSIGRIFAQLAKVLGFTLVAVTRNDRDTDELLRLGASHVINTAKHDESKIVMELTGGKGADASIDSVGGMAGTRLAYCLKPDGLFMTLGLLSGVPVDWAKIAEETTVKMKLFHLRHWNQKASISDWHKMFKQLIALVEQHRLNLQAPAFHFHLSEFKQAIEASESSGRKRGKVMLIND